MPTNEPPDQVLFKRLKLVLDLIELGDLDLLSPQIKQIEVLGDGNEDVVGVVESLHNREYGHAVSKILKLIESSSALQQYTNPEMFARRLEIENLNREIVEFKAHKVEVESQVRAFNAKFDAELGDLMQAVLKAELALAPADSNLRLLKELLPARTDEFIDFCCRHKVTAYRLNTDIGIVERTDTELFVEMAARFYPLPPSLIERYKDRWDWMLLSNNKALPWSVEFIERFEDSWNWGRHGLNGNEALPWSVELIERYKDRWDWELLSNNKALPWSVEFIERYKDRWGWESLSINRALPWSVELIERYKDRWDWAWGLSLNEALPWGVEFFERYKDRWGWEFLSVNEALPWSVEFLERYEDRWDDGGEDGIDIFGWVRLSGNESLPWSIELIERFEDRWAWNHPDSELGLGLNGNEALPWSVELIERYKDRWGWEFLSVNEALPWSVELIERYKDRWDWEFLSVNEALPWSVELIERYKDSWNWGRHGLNGNEALPWSVELIERYKNRWTWDRSATDPVINKAAWEKVFKPKLTDTLVDTIMQRMEVPPDTS